MASQAPVPLFSAEQHALFDTVGFVRLENAVPPSEVQEMRDRAWAMLEGQGFGERDPSTWQDRRLGKIQDLKTAERSFRASPILGAALDTVFGDAGWVAPKNWGQPLITFPNTKRPWLMPSSIWHFDHPYVDPGEVTGVNVFLFINDVEPAGGGAAVVQSSPLLANRMLEQGPRPTKLSEQNKAFLHSHQWLRGLKAQKSERSLERNREYMDHDTDIDGIPARVTELTGKAGDVTVCHPALFHAPAPNTSDQPRLMRTARVYSPALAEAIRAQSASH